MSLEIIHMYFLLSWGQPGLRLSGPPELPVISTLPQNTSSVLRTGEGMNDSEVSEELGLDSKPEKTQWFIYRSCDSIRIKWNYLKFSIECIDTINLYVSWEQFLRVVLAKEKWRAPYFQQRWGGHTRQLCTACQQWACEFLFAYFS